MQYKNKVEICGIDTSSLKVLKEEKKLELIKMAHNGDRTARDDDECGAGYKQFIHIIEY